MINNDEIIEESSFLSNDVLDDNNAENQGVESMNQCRIIDFWITGFILFQNDKEINKSIWSFNAKQRQIFDYVLTWEKNMKQNNSIEPK